MRRQDEFKKIKMIEKASESKSKIEKMKRLEMEKARSISKKLKR